MLELLPAWIIDLVKSIGFPALIFLIWYLDSKAKAKQFEAMLENQREERKAQLNEMREERERMFNAQESDNRSMHESMRASNEILALHASILAELKGGQRTHEKLLENLINEIRSRI